jgi:hypothetical protein
LLGAMLQQVNGGLLAVPYHAEAGIEVGKHGLGCLVNDSLIIPNGPRAATQPV